MKHQKKMDGGRGGKEREGGMVGGTRQRRRFENRQSGGGRDGGRGWMNETEHNGKMRG